MDEIQLVSFKLGAEEYGVDIMQVQEIIRLIDIVRVPKAPAFVEGIIDLRNKVLPIVDLRKRFDMPETEKTDASRIVVIDIDDMTVGLIVDSVSEVLRIPLKSIEPPPKIVSGIESRFLKGIGRVKNRLIILLDLAKIFSIDEAAELGKVEELVEAEEERHPA
ncbi:MAG: purine-binding chemotaxis protein CheW [Firmicutes bacterium]|nr:purine-binding chemotaxis protein CheW [Bacillota bacterium]